MEEETLSADFPDTDEAPKKKMHPGAKKNLLIIGGIAGFAVVLTTILSFMGSGDKTDPAKNLRGGKGEVQTRQVEDERYQEAEATRQAELLRSAENNGDSFLGSSGSGQDNALTPADLSLTEDINPDVAEKKVAPRLRPERQNANVGALRQEEIAQVEARRQSVLKQMQTILGDQIPVAHVHTSYPLPQPQNQQGATSANPAPGTPNPADQNNQSQKPPGYTEQLLKSAFATFDKPISADRDTLVIATVRSGPYSGARLQGVAKRDLDQGKFEFTRMVFGNKAYQINATGLDEFTLSTLVDGDYDGNYIARFVAPFLFSTASAIADARSQTGQEVIVGPQGQIVQSNPKPTTDQALAAGLRDGIRTAASVFSENVRPPTVNKETNSAIAVIWLN